VWARLSGCGGLVARLGNDNRTGRLEKPPQAESLPHKKLVLQAAAIGALALALAGCRRDMQDQPKYKPLAQSEFFDDHRSERPMVEDTVPRGYLRIDSAHYSGKVNGADVTAFPIPITHDDLVRGMDRFNIYCSPCHSRIGDGNGLIVKRGLRQPPSYHIPRLRNAPVGHFFDVITNGYGAMASYASRVDVDDRWRIIAYIRALQLSQNATMADVPAEERAHLTTAANETPEPEKYPYQLPGQISGQTGLSPAAPPPQSVLGPHEMPSPFSGEIPPAVPFSAIANAPRGPGQPRNTAVYGQTAPHEPVQSAIDTGANQ